MEEKFSVKYLRFVIFLIFIPVVINNCYTKMKKAPPASERPAVSEYPRIRPPYSDSTFMAKLIPGDTSDVFLQYTIIGTRSILMYLYRLNFSGEMIVFEVKKDTVTLLEKRELSSSEMDTLNAAFADNKFEDYEDCYHLRRGHAYLGIDYIISHRTSPGDTLKSALFLEGCGCTSIFHARSYPKLIRSLISTLKIPSTHLKLNQQENLYNNKAFFTDGVKDPRTVYYTEIPRPFSQSTYFLYGGGWNVPELEFAGGNVVLILQKLLENNFAIREAWSAANEWGCPSRMQTWEQLIVRLEVPDKRIYDFGFTSDSSKVQIYTYPYNPPCRPIWEYYPLEQRNKSYESKN